MHHVLVVGTHQLLALHAQILAEETAILLRFARAGQARVGRWRELLVDLSEKKKSARIAID